MKLYSQKEQYKLYHGNMLDMLEVIQPHSIDSIVCDPPYELNFMGKGWDNSGIAFNKDAWAKCYEVLKPGGYLLAFGGTRTYHRIACAIEDAGFEIRDCIMYLYGSGFPKSLNIGLAIDKKSGLQEHRGKAIDTAGKGNRKDIDTKFKVKPAYSEYKSELSKLFSGWGTALKPAYEPIIVARKPFKTSVAENIMQYGVGGINIDECRIDYNGETPNIGGRANNTRGDGYGFKALEENCVANNLGRFPANVIHDGSEEAIKDMPNTKGTTTKDVGSYGFCFEGNRDSKPMSQGFDDEGSASRYFKCCEITNKDKEKDIWKNLNVSIVEKYFMILKAIKESIVQLNVEDLQIERKDQNVKFAENLLNLCETFTVQENAEIKNLDFKKEELQVIQDFIIDYEKFIQLQSLVQYVENKVNIDIIQIMTNLLKLYGYVKVATTNNIHQNEEIENKRYLYTSKASKKDRDEGLDMFESKFTASAEFRPNHMEKALEGENGNPYGRWKPVKNIHPTVKPIELMQYLVRLVTPKNGTILDCFMGSGSTGKATMFENRERNANYKFIGIELTEEYLPICEARIDYALNKYEYDFKKELNEAKEIGQQNIFEVLEDEK